MISHVRRRAHCCPNENDASAGNCWMSACAKDFSSVRVNGGMPRRIDAVTLGSSRVKDGLSDSVEIPESLFDESTRIILGN